MLSYTRAYFEKIPALRSLVTRRTASGFELSNGVDISITTNSFRSGGRGRAVLLAVLDELAFWRDENSAVPDEEVYASLRPAMATLPQSMLVAISSPYRKSGLLFKKFRDHYGKDGDILVVHAPSKTLNPTLNQSIIDAAFADDPALAAAEWNAEWRNDLEGYVSFEVVRGCVGDHVEMAPLAKDRYFAFVDPAGGSGQDGFTAAISRRDGERVVIDAIRETRPPFSPESVIDDLCNNCLKSHNGPSFLNSVHV